MWVSLLLAAILLYLALRGIDWATFLNAIRNLKYAYLPIIILWGSFNSLLRAMRWRVLLTVDQDIPVSGVFWANMAGYFGNNVLPARIGELIRAMYVNRIHGVSASFALATGLVERFMDLIALILIGSHTLASSNIVAPQMETGLQALSWVAVAGLSGILIAPYAGSKLLGILPMIGGIKPSFRTRLDSLARQFLRGVSALHDPKRAGIFLFFTGLIWLMDGLGTLLLGQAAGLPLNLSQALLLLSALGLSSAIPSTPGYIGIYQFVAVMVLTPFGIVSASAVAYIVIFQVLNILIIAFWGTLSLWIARKQIVDNNPALDPLKN